MARKWSNNREKVHWLDITFLTHIITLRDNSQI